MMWFQPESNFDRVRGYHGVCSPPTRFYHRLTFSRFAHIAPFAMAPVRNARVVFNEVPSGFPVVGKTLVYDESPTIDIEAVKLNGGLLVKICALSLDPYMRNRMRPFDESGDMPAFRLGEVVTGFAVGRVLRSEAAGFSEDQHVYGFMPYQEYAVFADSADDCLAMPALGIQVVSNPHNLPWRYFVGILGMSGQTAYYGLQEISSPQAGETIFVSAAAGAVGQLVVQLAKIKGLRVIASCGSEDKVKILESLGADHVINRKTASMTAELKKYGPIDIYFDNVGGPTLEAAIENAAMHSRFLICGAISTYNVNMQEAYGVRNLWLVNRYRIRIEALVVIDWHEKYAESFYKDVGRRVASGELKYIENVYHGLQHVGQGLLDLMTGANVGKAVVVLQE